MRARIWYLSILFPLYLILLWFVFVHFYGQVVLSALSVETLRSAVSLDTRNPAYHYLLGRLYHYDGQSPDLAKAISHYRESVRLSPLQGGCWLDLSKASQTAGLTSLADAAMQRAISLGTHNPAVMWEAGVFYLMRGEAEKAVKNLKHFLLLNPGMQENAYDLAWKLPVDSRYVLENLIPDSYPYYKRYLFYLISADRIQEAKDLWLVMKDSAGEDEVFLKYTDFLISKHLYDDAENVWNTFTDRRFGKVKKEEPSLIWNEKFELDVLNGGFDWKISERPGVDVFLDRDVHLLGGRSLGLTFDGTQNLDIAIASQIVRVMPMAKYVLKGNIKTEALSTSNGLFFQIQGHDCKELNQRSDVITGTSFWREIRMEFTVPSSCHALSITIRREHSDKLNNKISGNAWIDGISLTQK